MNRSLFLAPDAADAASGAPNAAPAAAPDAGAAAAPAAAPAAPALSPIAQAIATAREGHTNPIVDIGKVAAAGGDGTQNPTIDVDSIAASVKEGDRERNADGTFKEVAKPAEGAVAAALAPEDGELEDGASEGKGADGKPVFTLLYPSRQPGGAPIEVKTDDREEYERHQQMYNGYMRGRDLDAMQADVEHKSASLEETAALIQHSPVAFVNRYLAVQGRQQLLMALISDPQVVTSQEERDRLSMVLQDEREARTVFAEQRAAAIEAENAAKDTVRINRQVNQNTRDVLAAINECVPPGLSGEQRNIFINDSRRALSQYARQQNLRLLDPTVVPMVLKQRITAFGGDPQSAADKIAARTRRAAGAPPATGQPRPGAAPVQPTGDQLVQGRHARIAGSKVGPAGAGAPPTGIATPPKGQGVKDRAAWAREQYRNQ